jgi:hypothetical protein
MLCPHCGSESPDNARSCPSCRYKFTIETLEASTTDTDAQERQLKRLLRTAFVLAVIGIAVWLVSRGFKSDTHHSPAQQSGVLISRTVAAGRIKVASKDFAANPFSVPAGSKDARLEGSFELVSPSANTMELLVVDENGFQRWKNHSSANALYTSGSLKKGTVDLQLPSSTARYYIVFNNRASPRLQVIQSDVKLNYRTR